ncbi:MAG: hypothetical protein MUE72_07005, partial [Chitinophagaceae bacterium]|nr:hypothetical protein [Chitinophagaceae bacterium]
MIKYALLIVFLISIVQNTQAQNVTGKWYGIGKVELQDGGSNAYMSELIVEQKGKHITGFLNYYFRDSLFTNKITGSFDAPTRTLLLNATNIIFHKSVNTNTGVDCAMSGRFILRIAKTESVLTGIMFANKNFRYTCPDINFKLKKEAFQEEIDATIPITKAETSPQKIENAATTEAVVQKAKTLSSVVLIDSVKTAA